MIELQKNFIGKGEVKGFEFHQLRSNGHAFLYEVRSEYNYDGVPETNVWYEIFERRISKEGDGIVGGEPIHFEEREIYPKSNSFGVWAVCVNNYNYALKKFYEMTDIVTEREKKKEEKE